MRTNRRGLALIQEFESCRLTAYLCSGKKWTIGWGATGRDVYQGLVWTQEQADARFYEDLQRFEREVESLLTFEPTSNEFSAMVSFAYNLGTDIDEDTIAEGLGDSTLLRKFNAGDIQGAANEFPRWNKSDGRVTKGLVRRREAERELFLSPDDADV